MPAKTFVVILNYRSPDETVKAAQSVRETEAHLAGVIIVDNDSGDGSVEQMAAALPWANHIVAPTNGGFSSGCNLGIQEALRLGADRILLLNSDAAISPDTLAI